MPGTFFSGTFSIRDLFSLGFFPRISLYSYLLLIISWRKFLEKRSLEKKVPQKNCSTAFDRFFWYSFNSERFFGDLYGELYSEDVFSDYLFPATFSANFFWGTFFPWTFSRVFFYSDFFSLDFFPRTSLYSYLLLIILWRKFLEKKVPQKNCSTAFDRFFWYSFNSEHFFGHLYGELYSENFFPGTFFLTTFFQRLFPRIFFFWGPVFHGLFLGSFFTRTFFPWIFFYVSVYIHTYCKWYHGV